MLITDTFNRADSATTLGNADTGQAWVAAEGTWGISSNQAYWATGGTNPMAYIDAGVADCSVTVTVSGTLTNGGGVLFRFQDTSNTFFVWMLSGQTYIYKRVGGSDGYLAQNLPAFAAGDVMRIALQGSSITLYKNAAQLWTGTDTSFQTATKHGLRAPTSAGLRFDNFTMADIGGLPGAAAAVASPAKPAGDDATTPVVLSGTSGSGTKSFLGATWDAVTPEPAIASGANSTPGTVWFQYTAAGPGTLSFTLSKTSAVVEEVDGNLLGVLDYDDGAAGTQNPTLDMAVSSTPVYIRLHEYASGASNTGWFSVGYSWSYAARVEALQLQGTGGVATVTITPAALKVDVGNGDPNALVNFSVDGGATLLTSTLNELGVLTAASVPLPALAKGDHTLTATQQTGSKTANLTFSVTNNPYTYPAAIAANDPPVPITQTGVIQWAFQDVTPGGEQYLFAINPSQMSTPHAGQVVSVDVTTAPGGQPLTWEGAPKPVTWSISGTLIDQGQLEAFARFLALNRRLYLIDHHSRAWLVSTESYDPQGKRALDQPYAHTFTVTALIYSGPVQL